MRLALDSENTNLEMRMYVYVLFTYLSYRMQLLFCVRKTASLLTTGHRAGKGSENGAQERDADDGEAHQHQGELVRHRI